MIKKTRTIFESDTDSVWMDESGIHWSWHVFGEEPEEEHYKTLAEAAKDIASCGREDIAEALRNILEGEVTDDDLRLLGVLTTRDEAGTHFTRNPRFPNAWLARMEELGLIKITRPVHEPTGIPYSEEYWSVEVTDAAAYLGESRNWGETDDEE